MKKKENGEEQWIIRINIYLKFVSIFINDIKCNIHRVNTTDQLHT